MVNESPFNPVTQPSAVSNATQYTGSSDAQYFQTAQMKLHAREQRLQVLALPLKTTAYWLQVLLTCASKLICRASAGL